MPVSGVTADSGAVPGWLPAGGADDAGQGRGPCGIRHGRIAGSLRTGRQVRAGICGFRGIRDRGQGGVDGCRQRRVLLGDTYRDASVRRVEQAEPDAGDLEFEAAGGGACAGMDRLHLAQVHGAAARPALDLEDVAGVDQVRRQARCRGGPGFGGSKASTGRGHGR